MLNTFWAEKINYGKSKLVRVVFVSLSTKNMKICWQWADDNVNACMGTCATQNVHSDHPPNNMTLYIRIT